MSKATEDTTETTVTDEPKKAGFTRRVGALNQLVDDLDVPVLFAKWDMIQTRDRGSQFDYLRQRMTELAEQKALSITYLHRQRKPIPDYCGMIILGLEFAEGSNEMRAASMPMDPVLRDYLVKVQAIKRNVNAILGNDKVTPKVGVAEVVPLGWKIGKESASRIRSRPGQHHAGLVADNRMTDVYMESDLLEADLPISDAWRILHQRGKYCVYAPTASRRAKAWLCEEVIPEAANNPNSEGREFGSSEASAPHMRRTGRAV
jgi:hypothetical protein